MPTGYTAAIKDGITFEQFTLGCARAFGALVMMRDEPADATIPEEFKPSPFYRENLAAAQTALETAKAMTDAEAETQCETAWHHAENRRLEIISQANVLRAQYEAIATKAIAWVPPTPDHVPLKEFMLDQLKQSIEHDCDVSYYAAPTPVMTPQEYRARIILAAEQAVANYTKAADEEDARTKSRNDWIKALRASLVAE